MKNPKYVEKEVGVEKVEEIKAVEKIEEVKVEEKVKKEEPFFYSEDDLAMAIKDMKDDVMLSLLVDLSGEYVWVAINRYINTRLELAESALASLDPFEKPTEMARNQGIRMGLKDLPELIRLERERRSQATE